MTKRTPQLETAILAGFADGMSLRSLCRMGDISRSAFLAWMHDDPDLRRRYAEAQLLHAEALLDDCLAIADDPFVDLGEGRPIDARVPELDAMRRARFRIDARLKVARLYFKRHEAALARQSEEEELLNRAAEAEALTEEAVPSESADEVGASTNPGPINSPRDTAPAVRLAATSPLPEPLARVANTG